MTASRAQIDLLVRLLDRSLEEQVSELGYDHWHSLLWNLHNVRPEDWAALPSGAGRAIREIVGHLGICYLAYESHAFGDGSREWGDYEVDGLTPGETPETRIAWLRACHAMFRNSVAALTDDELEKPRKLPWGEEVETFRIIEIMLQHATYHTGEINHIRAVLQGNDDWDHEGLGRDVPDATSES